MMSIAEQSSDDFIRTCQKIRDAEDDSITRQKAITMFTTRLQFIIRPYADPLPCFNFPHPSTIGTSHGHAPTRTAIVPRPFGTAHTPASFASNPNNQFNNRPQARSFSSLSNSAVPNRVNFNTPSTPQVNFVTPPQHVAAISSVPANRMRPFTTPSAPNRPRQVPINTGNSTPRTDYRCRTDMNGCGEMHAHFQRCPTSSFLHQSLPQHPGHQEWMDKNTAANGSNVQRKG